MQALLVIFALLALALALVLLVVFTVFFKLWLLARASGVPVTIFDMLFMRLRRVPPETVVQVMISMTKAGIAADIDDVESQILAGGNIAAVADALVRASKAGIDIDFRRLAAIDLAGRDVDEAVRSHVNPKVLSCPDAASGQRHIAGVCRDGVRLHVTARVTVRTRLDRLVGGAGEQTIVARVGEGIVSAVGGAEGHKQVLESPEMISRHILSRGLDSGTCFEILSVDIADIDVDENVGARLQTVQAFSDKRVAQARAEIRRAAAVAEHTEMQARTREMKSREEESKATLPHAVAGAFRAGRMGSGKALPATVNDRIRWRLASGS